MEFSGLQCEKSASVWSVLLVAFLVILAGGLKINLFYNLLTEL